jgi:hypothetical protein
MSRQRPNLRNRVAAEIEAAVLELAVAQPAWGQLRVSNALAQRGLASAAAWPIPCPFLSLCRLS